MGDKPEQDLHVFCLPRRTKENIAKNPKLHVPQSVLQMHERSKAERHNSARQSGEHKETNT